LNEIEFVSFSSLHNPENIKEKVLQCSALLRSFLCCRLQLAASAVEQFNPAENSFEKVVIKTLRSNKSFASLECRLNSYL